MGFAEHFGHSLLKNFSLTIFDELFLFSATTFGMLNFIQLSVLKETMLKVLCKPHYSNSHLETVVCKWDAPN